MLWPLWFLQIFISGSRSPRVLYNPQAASKYSEALQEGLFRCFDGTATLPVAAVNDDFCDCADGSDEPGTSACAGTGTFSVFYCQNAESVPRLVYASRVGDGICDCCDGTDEVPASCPNTCGTEGPLLRARRPPGCALVLELLSEACLAATLPMPEN